jgi:tetratricopeptide (TPR) repeat protein
MDGNMGYHPLFLGGAMKEILKPEDYIEPACPFCTDAYKTEKPRETVPVDRVLSRFDALLSKNDTEGAERHLIYWLGECNRTGDMRARLTLLDEMMGLMRKAGKEKPAVDAADEAIRLVAALKQENTQCHGTVLLNAATVQKAFGRNREAIELYEAARNILESLPAPASLLAGLYNNAATAYTSVNEYKKARALFEKALGIMLETENGECDAAITYLNLADLTAAEKGAEDGEKEIEEYLDKAEALLEARKYESAGYYAFVCEKCAPVFTHYGRFFYGKELKTRSEEIYERS